MWVWMGEWVGLVVCGRTVKETKTKDRDRQRQRKTEKLQMYTPYFLAEPDFELLLKKRRMIGSGISAK